MVLRERELRKPIAFSSTTNQLRQSEQHLAKLHMFEEADVTKLPIVKRFVGDSSEYAAQNKYFDRIQKIEVIAGQKEGENKDTDAYAESKEKFPVEADSKVIKAYKDSEKQLRKLNKDAREARKNGGPNMQTRLDKIKQDRNEVYVKFNRKYNEVKQGR